MSDSQASSSSSSSAVSSSSSSSTSSSSSSSSNNTVSANDEKRYENRLKEIFDLHDTKGKLYLEQKDLPAALREAGKRLTQENITALVKEADTEVSFEGFKMLVEKAGKIEKTDKDIETAFKVFIRGEDSNMVDVDALKQALTTLGDKLPRKQVDAFLVEASCGDRKGASISLEQFMKVIRSQPFSS
eukprot:TRINITY_DN8446_c0_g1_i1.p1 TRINITY_DN8446_c0_g1~~TRINITY_DN8446_c0_g1_i1.p1  ORF type:complete len:187 (+),score=69.33 TRINITY_DN8446_c0_g1_i1:48-608(+)